MKTYPPFKSYMFKVNEDSAVPAQDQILDQVQSEENFHWAISPIQFQTNKERVSYLINLGRKHSI